MTQIQISSNSLERGCWTCRARRKRCDGRVPFCYTCKRLGVNCSAFDIIKPSWMDGGREQQEYCNGLKKAIKRNRTRSVACVSEPLGHQFGGYSAHCRHSSAMEYPDIFAGLMTPPSLLDEISLSPPEMTTESYPTTPAASFQEEEIIQMLNNHETWIYESTNAALAPDYLEHLSEESGMCFPETMKFEANIAPMYPTPPSPPAPLDIANHSTENYHVPDINPMSWSLVIGYMDRTFYNIFPYLCPAACEMERGWLLCMISKSESVRLSVTSIEMFSQRKKISPARLSGEAEGTTEFQVEYRRSLEQHNNELNTLLQHNNTLSKDIVEELVGKVLICIVHYIYLEQILGAPLNYTKTHLSHANEVLSFWTQYHISESDNTLGEKQKLNNPISLFAGLLRQWIVIFRASADLHNHGTPPELPWEVNAKTNIFTTSLLASYPERLILAIASITSLAKWKNECLRGGTLSLLNLARRADIIEQDILAELALRRSSGINTNISSTTKQPSSNTCCNPRSGTTNAPNKETCGSHQKLFNTTTSILAHAARIYLHVVLSGPNPKINEIKKSVRKALRLFRELDPSHFYLVVWPLVVMGSVMGCDTEEEISARTWLMRVLDEIAINLTNERQKKLRDLLVYCWDDGAMREGGDVGGCGWVEGMRGLGLEGWELI